MNYKITTLAFSTTMIISGCASMGQQGRIGNNDGSDPCFNYLQSVDTIAIYYKDERLKQLTAGAAIGVVSGAALGAGTAALTHGDAALGAIIGGIAGGITGAFVASSYWDSRLKQANQQQALAASYVENDLREDIAKLNQVDRDISALVRCRTQKRDQIRKDFAAGKLTHQQAEQEWKKWGEMINKDREEMKYVGDALENIKKIEDAYNYAASVIEPSSAYNTGRPTYTEATAPIEYAAKSSKKTTAKKSGKSSKKHQSESSKPNALAAKAAPKQGKIKTMVSSVHEKYESINKNKNEFDKLALEAGNSNGFEQINSLLPTIYREPVNSLFTSTALYNRPNWS